MIADNKINNIANTDPIDYSAENKLALANNKEIKIGTRSKKIFGVLVIISIAVLSYFSLPFFNTSDKIEIIGRQPVTSTMGSAFNPFYLKKTDTLYYLHRSEKTPLAQVYSQKGNGLAQKISQDNSYYTDVISDADGNIYATRLNNLEDRHCEIVKFDSKKEQFTQLLDCGKRVVTALVLDERRNKLIYRYRPSISEPYAVYSFQLDTGRKEQLTHPVQLGNDIGDYLFSISTDNRILAVVEYDGNGKDKLKLINLKNQNIMKSIPFTNNVYDLAWNEKNNILVSNQDGLFIFNTRSLELEVVERSDQFGRLFYDENNGKLFTERGLVTVNIFKYSIENHLSEALTKSSGLNQRPTLGNYSNMLSYTSDRTGFLQIYIQEEGKANNPVIFDEPIEYVSAMSWSPHDDKLAVSMNNGIYLYSLTSKSWQKIADEFSKIHHVTFVDESIMFSAEVDGMWNIWQLSLVDNEVSQVTSKGGYSVQGNDEFIYFTKSRKWVLCIPSRTNSIKSSC